GPASRKPTTRSRRSWCCQHRPGERLRLFQAQNLVGENREIFRELQMAGTAQFTRTQLFQSMHNRFSILMICLMA
ncbi:MULTISPECIES: hypothetical protein, partial [unclassified Aeromonas]|uniref:hypothetical protein n=1 Tax=unclassified Aeromonas TaxID=257493 RepID=UPI0022E2005C